MASVNYCDLEHRDREKGRVRLEVFLVRGCLVGVCLVSLWYDHCPFRLFDLHCKIQGCSYTTTPHAHLDNLNRYHGEEFKCSHLGCDGTGLVAWELGDSTWKTMSANAHSRPYCQPTLSGRRYLLDRQGTSLE